MPSSSTVPRELASQQPRERMRRSSRQVGCRPAAAELTRIVTGCGAASQSMTSRRSCSEGSSSGYRVSAEMPTASLERCPREYDPVRQPCRRVELVQVPCRNCSPRQGPGVRADCSVRRRLTIVAGDGSADYSETMGRGRSTRLNWRRGAARGSQGARCALRAGSRIASWCGWRDDRGCPNGSLGRLATCRRLGA